MGTANPSEGRWPLWALTPISDTHPIEEKLLMVSGEALRKSNR